MSTPPTIDRWDEPVGANPRGTLIVLAGRGETAAVYARFGRRLSADAYRVRAVRDITGNPARSAQIVRDLIEDSEVGPVVIIGSDAGAVLALRLASEPRSGLAAVITAGLPSGRGILADEQTQLEVRSACPVHRLVLTDAEAVDPTALARDLPSELTLPRPADIGIPLLAIHGSDDIVATPDEALSYYEEVPTARIAIVQGGRHDILNDVTHRSVAASIVLFLEELRNGGVPTVALTEAARA